MLQIHNVDDGKSDWNINETHIIIPMINGDNKESDKILTSTLTLNSLEGGDHTILTSGLEHSLVIGLDKTLFDAPNYKSDLLIIQNSDLKTPVAYTLSYIDQEKSEILWQSPIPKDRPSGNEKGILEVRDGVLTYGGQELEKSEEINLGGLVSDVASQLTKTNGEIISSPVIETKKESQNVSYYSEPENSELVPVLPPANITKLIENVENKKIFENKSQSDKNNGYELTKSTQGVLLNVVDGGMEISESLPLKLVDVETDKKEKIFKNTNHQQEKIKDKNVGLNNFLYEESLPLKKKAKMKRTLTVFNSENQKSLLKQDVTAYPVDIKFPAARKVKQPLTTTLLQKEDLWSTSSDEPLINKATKRKKSKIKSSSKKYRKLATNSLITEAQSESKQTESNQISQNSPEKIEGCDFDPNKFNNIYELIECLRKCRMINATVWQTLHSGLKEMQVDILKEMNSKKNDGCSPERMAYSPQLKAFALVLYFKQPAAFNHLSHVYKAGWPTLNAIKEWKRRMNNHQRPNFVRVERSTNALK